jgi:hypothetical protein
MENMENMEKIKISDSEKNARLISNMATRPNGNSQYGQSGMSAKDVKEKFDAPFVLLVERHNALCDEVLGARATMADAAEIISAAEEATSRANSAAEKANNTELGNIDEALDAIIELQNSLIGGDA